MFQGGEGGFVRWLVGPSKKQKPSQTVLGGKFDLASIRRFTSLILLFLILSLPHFISSFLCLSLSCVWKGFFYMLWMAQKTKDTPETKPSWMNNFTECNRNAVS